MHEELKRIRHNSAEMVVLASDCEKMTNALSHFCCVAYSLAESGFHVDLRSLLSAYEAAMNLYSIRFGRLRDLIIDNHARLSVLRAPDDAKKEA
jgi:hypothetical protein